LPAPGPLPEAAAAPGAYALDYTRPRPAPGAPPREVADLGPWRDLLARQAVPSWGFWVGADGARRIVFPWPEALDAAFLGCCLATAGRRAGSAVVAEVDGAREIRVGPGLPARALKRAGPLLWAASSAKDLQGLPEARLEPGLVRWGRLDLDAVRTEAGRWARVEGPARPETVRPLSDRVLGLLGWMPAVRSISVERRSAGGAWEERVTFGTGP